MTHTVVATGASALDQLLAFALSLQSVPSGPAPVPVSMPASDVLVMVAMLSAAGVDPALRAECTHDVDVLCRLLSARLFPMEYLLRGGTPFRDLTATIELEAEICAPLGCRLEAIACAFQARIATVGGLGIEERPS